MTRHLADSNVPMKPTLIVIYIKNYIKNSTVVRGDYISQ